MKSVHITISTDPDGWFIQIGSPKDRAVLEFVTADAELALRVIGEEVFGLPPVAKKGTEK